MILTRQSTMPLAQTRIANLLATYSFSSRVSSGWCSPAVRVIGGRWSQTLWAPPQHARSIRARAQKPDSDGPKSPKDGEKERKRHIAPEEAKLAQEKLKKAKNMERVLMTATASPGLTGSIAILGGLYLHTNPYGNLHWNSEDLLVGLACALPLILLGVGASSFLHSWLISHDALVMLPDHQEQSGKDIEQTAARFADVRAKYEAAKGNSGGLDASSLGKPTDGNQQVGREGSTQRSSEPMRPAAAFEDGEPEASFSGGSSAAVRMPRISQSPVQHLRVSAQYIQSMLLKRGSKTAFRPLPVDVGLTAAYELGLCMLWLAVILTGLSYWERDRLYELGFPDVVTLLGRSMSLPEAGQWGALAALLAGLVGLAAFLQVAKERTSAQQRDMVRKVFLNGKAREGREFQMFQRNLKKSGATEPGAIASQLQSSLEASASAHKRLSAMLDSAKKERNAQSQWNAAMVALREVVGFWGVGASFIITGNLLAPWGAATVTGLVRSAYSRVQIPRLKKRRMELLSKLKDSLGDDAQVSQDVMELLGMAILGEAKSDNNSEGKKKE